MEVFKFHKTRFYPYQKTTKRVYKYKALVGFGGNKGDVKKTFKKVFRVLQNDRRLHVKKTSFILENPPFGYLEQAHFFNAVVLVQTSLSGKEFLRLLLHVEKRFGRIRSFKNAPRTLDLDIIIFDRFEYKDRVLTTPHPKWSKRISILVPMAYENIRKGRMDWNY
ncbi:MAG: 2-amino-4-hydroxy-6-hydroxymethyldihydropteridine diphosphokinase [Campylobacteraceae bacterium]|nr:2-amino-4-hydroxy-6-hydroxymethyldihydropteridine diphosphokinase [Campylobacteraceae bacterium]